MRLLPLPLASFRKNDGVTLIELLVVVAVSAIVLAGVTQFFISTNRTHTVLEKSAGTQQGVRAIMEMMTRDIRMAGLNPTGNAALAGFTADEDGTTETSIAFRYDYFDDDGDPYSDGDCDDFRERICYSHDPVNNTIIYSFWNGGGWEERSLTEDGIIESLTFEYYADKNSLENNNPMASPASNLGNIRIVRVTVCGTITGAYQEDLRAPHCFSSIVQPRNL